MKRGRLTRPGGYEGTRRIMLKAYMVRVPSDELSIKEDYLYLLTVYSLERLKEYAQYFLDSVYEDKFLAFELVEAEAGKEEIKIRKLSEFCEEEGIRKQGLLEKLEADEERRKANGKKLR